MKRDPSRKATYLLAAAIAILAANQVGGQDIEIIANSVAGSEVSDPPGFIVSNTDLLQTAFGSVSGSDLSQVTTTNVTGETTLRDGIWNSNSQSRGDAGVANDEFQIYDLDLTSSPDGYTLSGIDLYSNWGTGGGRDEIRVNISFSLVATPTVFDQILVVAAGNPLFIYNPPTQTQAKLSLSGFSLEGVAAIRFDWPSGQENGAVGYSEIDVFGTSTGNDTDPPTLSSTTPVIGATEVATVSNLVLTFNEDVKSGSGTIELRRVDTDALVESFDAATSAQLTFSGRDLAIDPVSSLQINTDYYLSVPSGAIQDVSGNPFSGIAAFPEANAYIFTTDGIAPMLVAGEALINGLPTADLTIRFDEAIQAGSGQITIHLASDGSIIQTIDVPSGAVTTTGSTATVAIDDLETGVAYYVNLTGGALTDLSGIAFSGVVDAQTIAFRTAESSFIHYWGFDGNASDSIGAHEGSLRSTMGFTQGLIGQAVNLAVNGDAILVDQPSLPETNFTLACWIKPTSVTATRSIAGTQRGDQSGAFLRLQGGGVPFVHLQSPEGTRILGAPEPVVVEEWTHLAFTVDETNGLVLYVNGQAAATDPEATGHGLADNFTMGKRPDVIVDFFLGLIDDVQVHAAVLTPNQINVLAGNVPLALKIVQNTASLDFEWNTLQGMQYDLVSSTDLTTPVSTWPIYDDGINPPYGDIPSAPALTNSLTGVTKLGPTRFFALIEEEIPPLLFEDFEATAAIPTGWVTADNAAGTAWGVGSPTEFPSAAASGVNCAGTNVTSFYTASADATLTSPAFAAPASGATLSFQRYVDTEMDSGGGDFGSVRILDADNADAEIFDGDFPVTPIEGIILGWNEISFPLPAAALGKNIKIQFQFVSNGSEEYSGFYIDDVRVSAAAP